MPVSANFTKKTGATSGQEPLLCLEITHAQLAQPLRMVRDTQDLVHGGNNFPARNFDVQWPDDIAGKPPRAPIRIDNTDRALSLWLDASLGGKGATVRFFCVMRDTPEVVEDEITCDLLRASQAGAFVTGELGYEDVLNTPALVAHYRPDSATGIF